MKKPLMSVHGLLDRELNGELRRICLEETADLGLSDRFFRIPLHVSLKRSFYVEDEEAVRRDIEDYLKDTKIQCGGFELFPVKDRLWLRVNDSPELFTVHSDLDEMLKERYEIPVDEFDRRYFPHISLFGGCGDRMQTIVDRLSGKIGSRSFIIDTYYIGTDRR